MILQVVKHIQPATVGIFDSHLTEDSRHIETAQYKTQEGCLINPEKDVCVPDIFQCSAKYSLEPVHRP